MTLTRIETADLAARPGLLDDLLGVFLDARRRRLQFLINLHTLDEDRDFFTHVVLPNNEVWVADADGRVVGFIAFAGGRVNHLYVAPPHQGRGVGSALLAVARRSSPSLELWAFEANTEAIAFYERRGFRIVERTKGAGNEARQPDVRMRWDAAAGDGVRQPTEDSPPAAEPPP